LALHWLRLVTASPSSVGITDYATVTTLVGLICIGRISSPVILSICQCVFFTIVRCHTSKVGKGSELRCLGSAKESSSRYAAEEADEVMIE